MSILKSKEIVTGITLVVGITVILDYFIESAPLSNAANIFSTYATNLAAFALVIGAVNMILLHYRHISKKTEGQWIYSAWLIFTLFITSFVAIILSVKSDTYLWIYTYVYRAASATMYSTTGFFIISAAYRAFRAKSKEAALLLGVGILVMLGNIGVGEVIWPGFAPLRQWLLGVGNIAGQRGLIIASSIAAVATGIKTIIGRERAAFGEVSAQGEG